MRKSSEYVSGKGVGAVTKRASGKAKRFPYTRRGRIDLLWKLAP